MGRGLSRGLQLRIYLVNINGMPPSESARKRRYRDILYPYKALSVKTPVFRVFLGGLFVPLLELSGGTLEGGSLGPGC